VKTYRYKTFLAVNRALLEEYLNRAGEKGYRLVSKEVSGSLGGTRRNSFDLIFEMELNR